MLAPLYMLIIELTFFSRSQSPARARRVSLVLFMFAVVLPALAGAVFLLSNPHWLASGYNARDFSLGERLLTETRVLWLYLRLIVLPAPGAYGLFHDDMAVSSGLLQPAGTLFAVLGVAGLVAVALWARKRLPVLSFGLLFFLVGHSLESTVLPLELVHEHRNYLPQYGILLAGLFYLVYPSTSLKRERVGRVASGVFVVLLAAITAGRSIAWGDPFEHAMMEVAHHETSARANYTAGTAYAKLIGTPRVKTDLVYTRARGHFERATRLDEDYLLGLYGLVTLSFSAEKLPEPSWLKELAHRLTVVRLDSASVRGLVALVQCQKAGPCRLTPDQMETLLGAAEANPTLGRKRRTAVLYAWVDYLANVVGDYPGAIQKARRSVQVAPGDVQGHLNLATLLVAVSQFEGARTQLALARRLDALGGYAVQIDAQESLLDAAERSVIAVAPPGGSG